MMSLSPGNRLGPYEILSHLGAGGMGEVYKARDTRLDRTVAIKVLPARVASDPDARQRFEREARAVAALNHPHICTLHDIGSQNGTDFLVMEYLEGETLADRLTKGALPLDQALRYGVEIADALDKAHRAGIVHRDLKPGNIMLTKSGAKLLDFGLAKTGASVVAGTGLSMLPTTPPNLTAEGTILGTFQYMAPEQLEGQKADARTDIFAFGAVLYEMLTGKKAFEGHNQANLIAAILEHDPPSITAIQPLAPPALDRVIRKALAKDPDRRWQSASDLRDEIEWLQPQLVASARPPAASVDRPNGRARFFWAALIVGVLAAGSGVTWLVQRRPAQPPELRLQIVTPDASPQFALSPDGRSLVFSQGGQLWLRQLDGETAVPLAGTTGEGTRTPFWSPDSGSIGFFADNQVKRLDLTSGSVQTIASTASTNVGATWNEDGVILVGGNPGPIERVSATGGARKAITRLGTDEVAHRHPQFLPDGQRFLFFSAGAPQVRGVYVGSLDSQETRRVVEADAAGAFLPPDYLLFARQQTLLAQRLDPQRLEPVGDPLTVAAPIVFDVGSRTHVDVSTSATGLLAYRTVAPKSRVLTWLDRAGREIERVGGPDPTAGSADMNLSPDGLFVAINALTDQNQDVWIVELARNVRRRFTFDSGNDGGARWSPDGNRLMFTSNRTGHYDVYLKSISGDSTEELLLVPPHAENRNTSDWSPDGRFVLYSSVSPTTARDLLAAPVAKDGGPLPVAQTPFFETSGRFSPDGRWVAYQSNESGRNEIYVQRFPKAVGKWQVSTLGGASPRWRRDGREIFYEGPDGWLTAVPVTLPTESTDVRPGAPIPLFQLPADSDYDVTPDGQRFLVNMLTSGDAISPITVVVNWQSVNK